VVEDCLSAMINYPHISYRDLLFGIASTFASRSESDDFAENVQKRLVSDEGSIAVGYQRTRLFHEGMMEDEDGKVYVFRQSVRDPSLRVRAYTLDRDRNSHDQVVVPQTDRRNLMVTLLHYSLLNPPHLLYFTQSAELIRNRVLK
jgi:hypothetical protein